MSTRFPSWIWSCKDCKSSLSIHSLLKLRLLANIAPPANCKNYFWELSEPLIKWSHSQQLSLLHYLTSQFIMKLSFCFVQLTRRPIEATECLLPPITNRTDNFWSWRFAKISFVFWFLLSNTGRWMPPCLWKVHNKFEVKVCNTKLNTRQGIWMVVSIILIFKRILIY